MNQCTGRVVLLTSDDIVARQMQGHLEYDAIDVVRTASAHDTWLAITRHRPQAVIVDLATRTVDGDQLMALSVRAGRAGIPLLVLSKQQSRRDLAGFAAILRARDILCRTESMPTVAARVRMWVASMQAELAPAANGFALVNA